jgi:hypothetical protein
VARDCVTRLILSPASASALTAAEWDRLLRQAARAGLAARLALVLEEAGALDGVPVAVRRYLAAARAAAQRVAEAVFWELGRIGEALAPIGAPVLLLKGAAYLAHGLPVAAGRVFGDIDLLVPDTLVQNRICSLLTLDHRLV